MYFPHLAGDFYARYRMSEYQALIADSVAWACGKPMPIEVACPATVEVELRRQTEPRRLLIHLVNNTGDMQRPVQEIIPVREVRIRLRADNVNRVRALRAALDLEFSRADRTIEFILPEIRLYELVIVE